MLAVQLTCTHDLENAHLPAIEKHFRIRQDPIPGSARKNRSMTRDIKGCWWLLASLATSVTFAAPQPLDITVYVFNVAQVPPATLRRAESNAARIVGKAGVRITWREGRTAESKDLDAGLHGSPWVPGNIDLRLYTERTIGNLRLGEGKLGSVLSFEENSVVILCDRVQVLANLQRGETATILGAAISHEIGHLLLHSSRYRSEGIMRENWLPAELQAAAQSRLVFTADQIEIMRDEVRRRQHPSSDFLASTH